MLGCTTFKPVEYTEVSLPDLIEVGETYKFTKTDGTVIEMKVTSVSADEVTGTMEGGGGRTILATDLQALEVETIDGGKTTLAVIGGIILLPIALAAIIVACMFGCGM